MSVKPSAKVLVLPRRARHPRRGSWGGAVDRLDERVAELERRIADFDRRYARLTVGSRFGAAGTISLLVHALVIFGLSFTTVLTLVLIPCMIYLSHRLKLAFRARFRKG